MLDLDELIEAVALAMVRACGAPAAPGIGGATTIAPPAVTRAIAAEVCGAPSGDDAILARDAASGNPVALLAADHLRAAATAAACRLATRVLARPDADVVAIVGAGRRADALARALLAECAPREVRVVDRDAARARRLADRLEPLGLARVVVARSYEEALNGAPVVGVATAADRPVVHREWVADGAHVNSVGGDPRGRELAPEVVAVAAIAVDSHPAGRRGGERALGELLAGRARLPRDAALTLFRSTASVVQDLAAVELVLQRCERHGIGALVELR